VLLEWDAEIPSFAAVHREALRARRHIERALARAARFDRFDEPDPRARTRVHGTPDLGVSV
jgi:hypothetical protein